jgi:bifunctional non-homologous end joining protein LigD
MSISERREAVKELTAQGHTKDDIAETLGADPSTVTRDRGANAPRTSQDATGVRLFTRNGHDWTGRFPLIARAALSLKAASCLIDGEAVACDDSGLPVFDRLRYRRDDSRVFLYAFDPLERDGRDLRFEPIERRKVLLVRLLAKVPVGLQVNEHIVEPGDVVFRHACQLGFEGIVSKRLGSPYRSGRFRYWVKSKNPEHPAVKREEEEDAMSSGA